MGLTDLFNYISAATAKSIFQVMNDFNNTIKTLAGEMGIPAWLLLSAALVLTVIVGFVGYKKIRLLMALVLNYFGFFIGMELFSLMKESVKWLPGWLTYIVGAIVAVAFVLLAFVKFSYVLFAVSAVSGYVVLMFYTTNSLISIGGALAFAVLSVAMIRTVFVLTSGMVCGFLTVSFASALFTKAEWLQLGNTQWFSFCLALMIAAIYVVVQYVTTRKVKGARA